MNQDPRPPSPKKQRIQVEQPEQFRKWAQSLGVSLAELKRITAEVGEDPDKVRAYLNTRA